MRSEWLRDVSAGEWISERLHPWLTDTGSMVPEGFNSYVRILHPVEIDGRSQRWAEVALRNGRIVHPEMQLHMIERPPGTPLPASQWLGHGFAGGRLNRRERQVLTGVLREFTTTPRQCWLCYWEGYSDVDDHGVSERLRLPNRSYLVSRGTVEDAVDSLIGSWDWSPNLWWPADRAWIVVTETDFAWTYIGGTAVLAERLVCEPKLEVVPAKLTDRPFYDSDYLNAALDSSGQ